MGLAMDGSKVTLVVDGYTCRNVISFEEESSKEGVELTDEDLYGNAVAVVHASVSCKMKINVHKASPDYAFLKRLASAKKKVNISFVDKSCSSHDEDIFYKDCYISIPKTQTGKDGSKVEFSAVGSRSSNNIKEK